jgi:hypothetical protein
MKSEDLSRSIQEIGVRWTARFSFALLSPERCFPACNSRIIARLHQKLSTAGEPNQATKKEQSDGPLGRRRTYL